MCVCVYVCVRVRLCVHAPFKKAQNLNTSDQAHTYHYASSMELMHGPTNVRASILPYMEDSLSHTCFHLNTAAEG